MKIKDRINSLREKLNKHNVNYYAFDNPTISDYEYDILLKELEVSTDLVLLTKEP